VQAGLATETGILVPDPNDGEAFTFFSVDTRVDIIGNGESVAQSVQLDSVSVEPLLSSPVTPTTIPLRGSIDSDGILKMFLLFESVFFNFGKAASPSGLQGRN
jgi:hypothetical protein